MRASLKMLLVVFVPALLSAQAMPVCAVNWRAMQDETVEVLRGKTAIAMAKPDVTPAAAAAELDIRWLPDQEPDSVKRVHGNERLALSHVGPGVKFVYDILRYAR